MKFAASLNVHANPALARRNIELLKRNVTGNICMLVEGSAYQNWPIDYFHDITVIEGFKHNVPRNPYKNVLLNLKKTYENFPNADWYVFSEFDNFIVTEKFKNDFQYLHERYSLIANDFRHVYCEENLFQNCLNINFEDFYCMLGCCYFIKNNLMKMLHEYVFDNFLNYTSFMPEGYYPNFFQYDVAEVLIPTCCMHFDFNVFNYARFKEEDYLWQGMAKKYMMRFRPNVQFYEVSKMASIIHPIKEEEQLDQILYTMGYR